MFKHILYTLVIPIVFITFIISVLAFTVNAYIVYTCIHHMAETDLRPHFSFDICNTPKGRGIVEIEYNRVMEEQHRLMMEWLEERK